MRYQVLDSVIQGGLDLISAIWTGSWQGVVNAFASIFGGIAEICKAPMNAVIAIINGAIRAINSISVDILHGFQLLEVNTGD